MLGLGDFSVFAAYVLCILSALLCVIYGIVNWNKGGDITPEQAADEVLWNAEDKKIDDELAGSEANS